MFLTGKYTFTIDDYQKTKQLKITVHDTYEGQARARMQSMVSQFNSGGNWDMNSIILSEVEENTTSHIPNNIESRLQNIEIYLREMNDRGKKVTL